MAALVLMPILVFEYNSQASRDEATNRDEPGPRPAAAVSGTESPEPDTIAILGFDGIKPGETVEGFKNITLKTRGGVGVISYQLTAEGSTYQYSETATTPPYLFAPHGTGWDTRWVSDGTYTLRAQPVRGDVESKTITFVVRNTIEDGGPAASSTSWSRPRERDRSDRGLAGRRGQGAAD